MRLVRKRSVTALAVALLVTGAATGPASAEETMETPSDPAGRAQELTEKLGKNRTGGAYYEDGNLVVTVTDEAAAQTIRDSGGTPKLVSRSAAELESIRGELDALKSTPDTAWGIDAKTNQIRIEIFEGATASSRAQLAAVAEAHPGAIRVHRNHSKLSFKATDLRGGNGIWSEGWLCSAGFNTKNSSGDIYTLTAGHCVPGTGNLWEMDWNGADIGTQNAYNFGGSGGDWATIRSASPEINPLGTVRYWGGDYKQIDRSRYPIQGQEIDRIGVNSQDTTGIVTGTGWTAYIDGVRLDGMFASNVCALGGDSGGPALTGTTALGLLSGGTGEKTCTSSSTGDYQNFFTPVQKVLDQRGLHVY